MGVITEEAVMMKARCLSSIPMVAVPCKSGHLGWYDWAESKSCLNPNTIDPCICLMPYQLEKAPLISPHMVMCATFTFFVYHWLRKMQNGRAPKPPSHAPINIGGQFLYFQNIY